MSSCPPVLLSPCPPAPPPASSAWVPGMFLQEGPEDQGDTKGTPLGCHHPGPCHGDTACRLAPRPPPRNPSAVLGSDELGQYLFESTAWRVM